MMRPWKSGIFSWPVLTLFILVLTPAAGANPDPEPPDNPVEAQPADPDQQPLPDTPATAVPSPLMQDIQALWEAQQATLAELVARFEGAAGEDEALALQRRIEQVKADTELQILRLQLNHARQEGRPGEQIARLEEAIKLMTEPRPMLPPRPRDRSGDGAGN